MNQKPALYNVNKIVHISVEHLGPTFELEAVKYRDVSTSIIEEHAISFTLLANGPCNMLPPY